MELLNGTNKRGSCTPKKPGSEGSGFVKKYWNPKAQKWMIAEDYGYKAWPFGKRKK